MLIEFDKMSIGPKKQSGGKKRSFFKRKKTNKVTQDPITEFQKLKLKKSKRTISLYKKMKKQSGGAKGKKRSLFKRKAKVTQDPITEFQKMKLKLIKEGKSKKAYTFKDMQKNNTIYYNF